MGLTRRPGQTQSTEHVAIISVSRTQSLTVFKRALCKQACALEMEACRAAWRGLAELPSEAREDPRAVAFLAGVGEVLVAAAIVRATVRAHQVKETTLTVYSTQLP